MNIVINDPRWKNKTIECSDSAEHELIATRHATRAAAVAAMPAGSYYPCGFLKDGVTWYQLLPEEKEAKAAPVGATLRALFDECGDDRDVFVAAAEIMEIKGSTAMTYWYTIKKERGL